MKFPITPAQAALIGKRKAAADAAAAEAEQPLAKAKLTAEALLDVLVALGKDNNFPDDAGIREYTLVKENGQDMLVLAEQPQPTNSSAE